MSSEVVLHGLQPMVDRRKIGISYVGAGALLVVELGVVKALIDRGIVPDVIAGVSSGAFSGLAHALDPHHAKGVDVTAGVLGGIRDISVGLAWWQVALRLATGHWQSLGDHTRLRPRILQALRDGFGLDDPRLRDLPGPPLNIGAADRIDGSPVWFDPDVKVVDAVLASSAIPAVFPWITLKLGGRDHILVDGGMVSNQPLSQLVLQGCGTLFAVSVTPPQIQLKPPANLIDNGIGSAELAIRRQESLEAAYVQERIGNQGVVHRLRPDLSNYPIKGYNYTPELVRQVIAEVERQIIQQLQGLGY
jgi:NTE family protein